MHVCPTARLIVYGTPPYCDSDWVHQFYLAIKCLFLLVLDCLQDRCPSGGSIVLHKIAATIGGGVSVAKAQCFNCCSRAVNVVSYPQLAYPVPLIRRLGTNPNGFPSYSVRLRVYLWYKKCQQRLYVLVGWLGMFSCVRRCSYSTPYVLGYDFVGDFDI